MTDLEALGEALVRAESRVENLVRGADQGPWEWLEAHEELDGTADELQLIIQAVVAFSRVAADSSSGGGDPPR